MKINVTCHCRQGSKVMEELKKLGATPTPEQSRDQDTLTVTSKADIIGQVRMLEGVLIVSWQLDPSESKQCPCCGAMVSLI